MCESKKWKTKNKFHGIFAIVLVYLAMIIGAIQVFQNSLSFGFILLALLLVWPWITAWFYCRKCLCRLDCGHVLLGFLTRFMPQRKSDKINLFDIIPALTPILLAVVLPQYWLLKHMPSFWAFWLLILIGGLEVFMFVCKKCSNDNCPLNKATH